jgi:thiol-disulfide isomerase/thioredoxin
MVFGSCLMAQLPDFTKTDNHGVTHHLYDDLAAGKAVLLAFGAGWCGPCVYTDQFVENFYKKFGSGNCKVETYLMLFETNTPYQTTTNDYAVKYAQRFNLTMPILTDIGDWGVTGTLTDQYFTKYQTKQEFDGQLLNYIPFFLVILPDKDHPENSTVKEILNIDNSDLEPKFTDAVAEGGFYPPAPVTLSGNLCSALPYTATLTSGFTSGWNWSTGETTQTITVHESGAYTVTNDGCSVTTTVEFNPPPVVGTASASAGSICQDGLFALDYTIPPGGSTDVTWMLKDDQGAWQEFAPAGDGSLVLTADGAPGTEYIFAVRARNGSSGDASCEIFSNEVHVTVNDHQPTVVPATASASKSQVCFGAGFELNYTGGASNSIWEIFDDQTAQWYFLDYAGNQPLSLDASFAASTVNGLPGNKFRVVSPDGDCYSISNTVEVAYLWLPQPGIIGPDLSCAGASGITLGLNNSYPSVLWSTGATTNTITVSPTQSTSFSVTVTDNNGCSNSAAHDIFVMPQFTPIINTSAPGSICPGGATTLSFGGFNSSAPCTTAPFGQWPEAAYTPQCTGDFETITEEGYLGDYSLVNVISGRFYYFFSSDANYGLQGLITTIGNTDSTIVFASGKDLVLWKAGFTGTVRVYSSSANCTSDNNLFVVRGVSCISDPALVGTFNWSTAATTPSITVSPTTTTSYALTFSDAYFNCPNIATKQVMVGVEGITESTTAITSSSAVFNWVSAYNPDQWQLQYKGIAPGDKWTDLAPQPGSLRSLGVTGLKANQTYNWHIRAKCGKAWTQYSTAVNFKTLPRSGSMALADVGETNGLQLLNSFNLKASPNPSAGSFNITITGNASEMVTLQVFDALGRLIETKRVMANTSLQLGQSYKAGTYYIRAIQGAKHTQVALIKIGN